MSLLICSCVVSVNYFCRPNLKQNRQNESDLPDSLKTISCRFPGLALRTSSRVVGLNTSSSATLRPDAGRPNHPRERKPPGRSAERPGGSRFATAAARSSEPRTASFVVYAYKSVRSKSVTAASVASVSEARLPVEELDELPVPTAAAGCRRRAAGNLVAGRRGGQAAGLAGRTFLHCQHLAAQIGIVAGRRQAAHPRILRTRSERRRRLALPSLSFTSR